MCVYCEDGREEEKRKECVDGVVSIKSNTMPNEDALYWIFIGSIKARQIRQARARADPNLFTFTFVKSGACFPLGLRPGAVPAFTASTSAILLLADMDNSSIVVIFCLKFGINVDQ